MPSSGHGVLAQRAPPGRDPMGHRGIILSPLYMGYSPAGSLLPAVSNTLLLQGASPLGWRGQTAPVPPPNLGTS